MDTILNFLHGWTSCELHQLKDLGVVKSIEINCDPNQNEQCFIHEQFFVDHLKQVICKCGKKAPIEKPNPNSFAESVNMIDFK